MIEWTTRAFFVKAYPEAWWRIIGKTKEQITESYRKAANDLLKEIDRHCDPDRLELDVEGYYSCSFCGSEVANKDDYECCEKSIEEHESGKLALPKGSNEI